MPYPPVVSRMPSARQRCFCGLLRFARTASRRTSRFEVTARLTSETDRVVGDSAPVGVLPTDVGHNRGNMAKVTSCGVIVTDGDCLLLGHATGSPRWDIPKGVAVPGETFAAAAARELAEETGLAVPAAMLDELGVHPYLSGKDLALFVWVPARMPRPETLVCRSTFQLPGRASAPEFDRFGIFPWDEALPKVGRSLLRVLLDLRAAIAEKIDARNTPASAALHAPKRQPPA